jgi:hypothetical protein
MGQFTTRLVQYLLKTDALFREAALQGPSAQVQLSREILYARTLTSQ